MAGASCWFLPPQLRVQRSFGRAQEERWAAASSPPRPGEDLDPALADRYSPGQWDSERRRPQPLWARVRRLSTLCRDRAAGRGLPLCSRGGKEPRIAA